MKTTKTIQILLFLIVVTILISSCAPPDMRNLKLNNDSRMYAGKGEICQNPYIKLECAEGLECIVVASKPTIIKVCYPPGTELEEDLINRHLYDNENYAQQTNSTHRTE